MTAVVGVAGLPGLVWAQADAIPAGVDAFKTLGYTGGQSHSYYDFSGRPIPAGFFHPASDPFSGIVHYMGLPLDVPAMGSTDSLVDRGPIEFNNPWEPTATAATWIQMRELSTQSVELVRVSVGGWLNQIWRGTAHSGPAEMGQIIVTRTHQWLDGAQLRPAAGTWEIQLPVRIDFGFARLADPALAVSLAAEQMDTVLAQGSWVSDAVLDVDPPPYVYPGTAGFVPNISGYPDQQVYDAFYGEILDRATRRGHHDNCPPHMSGDLPMPLGHEPVLPDAEFIAGTWANPADPVIVADAQSAPVVGPGEVLFGYRWAQDVLSINGRVVGADGQTVTYAEQVALGAPEEVTPFPARAAGVDDPAVLSALIQAGLNSEQIDQLRVGGPPVHSGIIAMLTTESVADVSTVTGEVVYTYDGYETGRTAPQYLFHTGDTIKLIMLLYQDLWCTGYMIRVPAHGPADLDHDGDVDLADYVILAGCLTGPGGGLLPGCVEADLTGDADVDLADFGSFQVLFTSDPSPHLDTYSYGDCLRGTEAGRDYCPPDQVELTVAGHTLHVLHQHATYNCCLPDIVVSLSVEGSLLRLREEEVGGWCFCLCCYDVEATVVDLASGIYTVELCWEDYDTGGQEVCYVGEVVIP